MKKDNSIPTRLLYNLSPLIWVIASDEVQDLCTQNYFLNLADLFKPFGYKALDKVTIRDGSGLPKPHNDFSVRFLQFDPALPLANPGIEDALQSRNVSDLIKNHAMTMNITNSSEENKQQSQSVETDLEDIRNKSIDELAPWFSIYRDTFFSYYRPIDHETFDHPVCWVMAVSASNPDPINTLTTMFERSSKATLGNLVDPDVLKYYILIYDPKKDNLTEVQATFERMKKTFGLHCDMLTIPSRSGSPISHLTPTPDKPNLWNAYRDTNQKPLLTYMHQLDPSGMRSGSRSGYPGQYFGANEIDSIADLVKRMTLESIIPFLERKMHHMNEQVASSRRGFTGRLLNVSRRYFNTSRPNSPSPTGSTPNNYTYNSTEGQMRKLADLAFMLRDFDLAQSTYEAVKKDFQADKSWNFYSGAQMMVGLCLLMSDEVGHKIEVERYFDKALAHYTTSRLMLAASRTCFLYHQMFIYHDRYADIPLLLNHLVGEDSDLRSGLSLEQIAYTYLSMPRPHNRKYAYYLTLAGSRYNRCSQREHAYNCYLKAHRAFQIGVPIELDDGLSLRIKKWNHIEDHISFSLGRQCSLLGQILPSIQHFLWLLNQSQQAPATQAAYLKEFLYAYNSYVKSTNHHLLLEPDYYLPIPSIDSSKISIELENKYDSQVFNQDNSKTWQNLESQAFGKDMISDLKTGLVRKSSSIQQEGNWCLVDEPLLVKMTILNPLHLSLDLSQLKLDCSYEGENTSDNAFELSTLDDFVLNAMKRVEIVFRIIPKMNGKINIKGLFFTINESAASYKSFETQTPSKLKLDSSLAINVITKMPQLQVKFIDPPQTILSGEVVSSQIELKNCGSHTLSKLWIKLSHHTFFSFESHSVDMDTHPLKSVVKIDNQVSDCSIIELDLTKDASSGLEPGQTTTLPIFIRGDRIGNHSFYLLFYCKAESEDLYRTTRFILPLSVQPSLKINAFTRPSTLGLDQFILGVEVENVHSDHQFIISQLSTCSKNWKITPINIQSISDIDNHSQIQKLTLDTKANLILYFNIQRINPSTPKLHSEISSGDIDWNSPEAHLAKSLQALILDAKQFDNIQPIDATFSDIPLHGRSSSMSLSPTKTLYFASRSQFYQSHLAPHSKYITNKLRDNIFPLYMSNDIDMSLHWRVKPSQDEAPIRHGHHFIIGINFSIPQNPLLDIVPSETLNSLDRVTSPHKLKVVRALFETTAIEKSQLINHLLSYPKFANELPLKVSTSCSDIIRHDFNKHPTVTIPVKFLITNCSWNRFTKIHLILIPPAASEPPSTLIDPNSDNIDLFSHKNPMALHFQWKGVTQHELILPPNETVEMVCEAQITYPGVYNLNNWQLTAQIETQDQANHTILEVLKQVSIDPKLTSLDHSYLHSPSTSLLCKVVDST